MDGTGVLPFGPLSLPHSDGSYDALEQADERSACAFLRPIGYLPSISSLLNAPAFFHVPSGRATVVAFLSDRAHLRLLQA